jgi:hypothetical protein
LKRLSKDCGTFGRMSVKFIAQRFQLCAPRNA